ncbi:MAG: hypothetical protein PHC97_01060 [Patescibacteria group bacterium]|nr:hypothetical protein [Patescibacteria group bacterium]
MTKNIEKTIIIFAIAALIIICGSVVLVWYWNNNPEPLCNRAGGFWDFNQKCENLCDKNIADYDCNDNLFHAGCWCGLEKCWDGKQCTERTKK